MSSAYASVSKDSISKQDQWHQQPEIQPVPLCAHSHTDRHKDSS